MIGTFSFHLIQRHAPLEKAPKESDLAIVAMLRKDTDFLKSKKFVYFSSKIVKLELLFLKVSIFF